MLFETSWFSNSSTVVATAIGALIYHFIGISTLVLPILIYAGFALAHLRPVQRAQI